MSYIDLYKDADRTTPIPGGRRRRRRPAPPPASSAGMGAFSLARLQRSAVYRKSMAHGRRGGHGVHGLAELGDIGFSFKSLVRGAGRGLKKVGTAGFKYATPVGLAYTAYKGRKTLGRIGLKALQYGTPAGLAYTAGRKLLGGGGGGGGAAPPTPTPRKRPPRPIRFKRDVGPSQTEDEAPEDIEETSAEDTDTDEGGGDEGGEDEGGEEMEGMGFSFKSLVKGVGRGIGKGAKVVGRGAGAAGRFGGQIALTGLKSYLGVPQGGGGGGGGGEGRGDGGGGIDWKSPVVLGVGAAAVIGTVVLLSRRRSPSPA